MPWVVFEPTIPVLEQARTVHALDRAATLIGVQITYLTDFRVWFKVILYVIFSWRRWRQKHIKCFHGQLVVTLHSLSGSWSCAPRLRIRASTTKWSQIFSVLVWNRAAGWTEHMNRSRDIPDWYIGILSDVIRSSSLHIWQENTHERFIHVFTVLVATKLTTRCYSLTCSYGLLKIE
jgi:hypothetical protein